MLYQVLQVKKYLMNKVYRKVEGDATIDNAYDKQEKKLNGLNVVYKNVEFDEPGIEIYYKKGNKLY